MRPPERLDHKIEFPLPDKRQKRTVFYAAMCKMYFGDELDSEDYISRYEKIIYADASAICAEAGMMAGPDRGLYNTSQVQGGFKFMNMPISAAYHILQFQCSVQNKASSKRNVPISNSRLKKHRILAYSR